jgi:predicted molibdopterin-dependent oxidoreductase YjgC
VRTSKKNKVTDEKFWLLSPKTNKALNTQFNRGNSAQLHPDLGYEEGQEVKLSSEYGSHSFIVQLNEDLRPDCVLVSNNTIGVNFLTPSMVSYEGDNACYQEVKVEIAAKAEGL